MKQLYTIPSGIPRYFRTTRAEFLPMGALGRYDGGGLLFAKFNHSRGDYFVSLKAIEWDTSGLYLEVNQDGKVIAFAHPDVVRV